MCAIDALIARGNWYDFIHQLNLDLPFLKIHAGMHALPAMPGTCFNGFESIPFVCCCIHVGVGISFANCRPVNVYQTVNIQLQSRRDAVESLSL